MVRRLALIAALASLSCGPGAGSIGAMLTKQHSDGRVLVRQVPHDMESAKAGLEPGDEVLFIDGQDARLMSAQEVHQALIGSVGSSVQLTVLRGGQVLRLIVRRGALK